MDVIQAGGDIRSNLNSQRPIRENREIRVPRVSQSIAKIRSMDILIHQVDIIPEYCDPLERNQARVVTSAYHRHPFDQLRRINQSAELPLDNNDVLAAQPAAPGGGGGGGGRTRLCEIFRGGADFREVIDSRLLRQSLSETCEGIRAARFRRLPRLRFLVITDIKAGGGSGRAHELATRG
ncbi:unnamed protein product [Cuscuta epithymum]|uniref:Uncharacterized protein n=1 Tax=Cuscuta epithymum TaxID=186058 RepID=A0AAV0FJX1_9ASTE|nr:unnamed protein product [Cuscuta epithymum]